MARVKKRAIEVDPVKASILGPDTMVFTDEVIGDQPVLVIEQAPANFEDLELAKRRARDLEIHRRWLAVGGDDPAGRRASPPTKGSVCSYCGATDQVLASVQASGPWRCAWGCA
jgi:hypothetical protein